MYEGSSWLKKPVKTVIDLLPAFEGCEKMYVLDLGCGVGINCIPIARKFKHVERDTCFVKMLERIRNGVRDGGMVCLIINTSVSEVEKDTSFCGIII